ncbi:MAG: DUF72 domain-containing protein [Candidatus Eisenbacteria bacterium]|uniref:DUF72 domain-containing protein n=1 Tax=Eiseniibacteriota bacterium TaxID=2212470 RepID=A0A956RNE8_UNCEI|nr:DUF72 domain-containing protein [Candidatus Eisenbacteria bacterium]
MKVWVGTSGFSYKPWKGPFYPVDLPDGDMLRFYGERLPAVEIDNSFYRMPKKTVLEGWTHQVPEAFRFTLKASRRITHFARLKNTDEPMSFLMSNVRELGPRLGAVLFQLPPNLKKDVDRLRAFLPLIPEDIPAAFEFRHESWFDEEVYTVLREHERALCQADTDEEALDHFVTTASWGYLRLRREDYTPGHLRTWAERIREQAWSHAFVFFKHEDGGTGPRWAGELRDLTR